VSARPRRRPLVLLLWVVLNVLLVRGEARLLQMARRLRVPLALQVSRLPLWHPSPHLLVAQSAPLPVRPLASVRLLQAPLPQLPPWLPRVALGWGCLLCLLGERETARALPPLLALAQPLRPLTRGRRRRRRLPQPLAGVPPPPPLPVRRCRRPHQRRAACRQAAPAPAAAARPQRPLPGRPPAPSRHRCCSVVASASCPDQAARGLHACGCECEAGGGRGGGAGSVAKRSGDDERVLDLLPTSKAARSARCAPACPWRPGTAMQAPAGPTSGVRPAARCTAAIKRAPPSKSTSPRSTAAGVLHWAPPSTLCAAPLGTPGLLYAQQAYVFALIGEQERALRLRAKERRQRL
jgi:hypothetical protein